jgi:transposase-like protein
MVMDRINGLGWLRNKIVAAEPDLLRKLLQLVVEGLMGADADKLCGAGYGEISPDRVNQRNGYRERPWDTRVGSINLAIPKLRRGSYFPAWLLEPRRRAEKALMQVVTEAYVCGVSTRRMDGLLQTLGLDGISKAQVSELAKSLDAEVHEFRGRSLSQGPYRYVWLDALTQRCREGGRVVNVSMVVATGVNAAGKREILGFDVFTSEDASSWTAFLRELKERGLNGVELIISDAHPGLKGAIAATFPGVAWQRCRTHYMCNLLTRVPKNMQQPLATCVRTIFSQPDAEAVLAQHKRVIEQLSGRFPQVADHLSQAGAEILAFVEFPKEHWRQIWSNNPQERLNKEIRRRTDVVGIFPNRESILRLVGAVLVEQHEEWAISRRYMTCVREERTLNAQTEISGEFCLEQSE